MTVHTATGRLDHFVENALSRIATPSDQVTMWDFSISAIVVGPGQMASVAVFTVFAKAPLLGSPDMCTTGVTPLDQFHFSQEAIDVTIRQSLETLRNQRSVMLKT